MDSTSRWSSSFDVNGSVATNDGTPLDTSVDTNIDTDISAFNTDTSTPTPTPSSSSHHKPLSRLHAQLVKMGLMMFMGSMCVALPVTLLPQYVLYQFGAITKTRKERLALSTGQFCARWLLRIIPFLSLDTIVTENNNNSNSNSNSSNNNKDKDKLPEPAVWVCNHTSMLDVFILMAADRKLRGRNKRPLKIVYWQQLEANLVTRLLFQQAGFIPVNMAPGVPGTANDYDISSFKRLLRDSKQAFADGFDIGILPEGQLNPTPELGLLPVFSGAFTLARLSKRPVQFLALHGAHHLWHPIAGLNVTGRKVTVRRYPEKVGTFKSANEFVTTFTKVVGHFGTTGQDLPAAELDDWLSGAAWEKLQANEAKA
jgi:1-acyl-sn-glycerol-3-phosphate acyltransferase